MLSSNPNSNSRLQKWQRRYRRFRTSPRRTTQIALVTIAIICITALIAIPKQRGYKSSWPIGEGSVSSPEALCSAIGEELIKEGGGAVDAVIGTALCTGVINSYASGIGGGAFLLVRPRGGVEASVMYDCRETAPAAARPHIFDKHDSVFGGLAVGIPGELTCFAHAHKRFGRLPWARLFKGAITLARDGFPMPKGMANRLHQNAAQILSNPEFKKIYAPSGSVLTEGEICNRRNLAETLDKISDGGVDVFYKGEIADQLVATIRKEGGIVTKEDFSNYKAVQRSPIFGTYKGNQIVVPPAPSAGPIMLSILKILENLPDFHATNTSALQVHRLIEAIKFGKAQHTLFGDPISDPAKMKNITDWVLSNSTASYNAAQIDDNRTYSSPHYGEHFAPVDEHGTCHIAVLTGTTADYEAASLTTTTNMPFGSWIMDPTTGIILNDEMDDFAKPNRTDIVGRPTNEVNWPRGGRRPLSSMTPMVVEDGETGEPVLVLGASGGGRIPTTVAQVLISILDGQHSAVDAVQAPRFHHGLIPEWLEVEEGMKANGVAEGLEQRGHTLHWYNGTVIPSLVQVVHNKGGVLQAVADDRIERIGVGQ
ncbi:hypothetical protein HK097_006945 [Rhizophlyctis rosea]|uniref:Glutathione hydrolase n=1 Tax=Rhizophlyctis rosea TaxID=64517 RepID=A0AAD5SFG5_9FUNG|nr:hypothetical protein HK097_006945 [Rhizophlyctis rosea]